MFSMSNVRICGNGLIFSEMSQKMNATWPVDIVRLFIEILHILFVTRTCSYTGVLLLNGRTQMKSIDTVKWTYSVNISVVDVMCLHVAGRIWSKSTATHSRTRWWSASLAAQCSPATTTGPTASMTSPGTSPPCLRLRWVTENRSHSRNTTSRSCLKISIFASVRLYTSSGWYHEAVVYY